MAHKTEWCITGWCEDPANTFLSVLPPDSEISKVPRILGWDGKYALSVKCLEKALLVFNAV